MANDQKKLQGEPGNKQEGKACLLTEEALRKHDLLTGATELRQFACPTCNHPWWTHVPRTKPISTCNSCHVCYDALDRDEEFGIGRFICIPCDHTFYARCEATEMQECFKCSKLTGPPYINPRFKPLPRSSVVKKDSPPPRIHTILNASTPHESTGSTIAFSNITEDLGSDIFVLIEKRHTMSAKDYSKPFGDEPVNPQIEIPFSKSDTGDVGDLELGEEVESELGSAIGEIGDLQSELESIQDFEFEALDPLEERPESGREEVSRRRTAASDSESSDSDGEADKMSTEGSEPDSGIGTGSNIGSGTSSGSTSPSASELFYRVYACSSLL